MFKRTAFNRFPFILLPGNEVQIRLPKKSTGVLREIFPKNRRECRMGKHPTALILLGRRVAERRRWPPSLEIVNLGREKAGK